jgi:predicted kinase
MTLTILRGLSGSGKSTWAESQPNAVVVSRDKLRVALFGDDGPDYYKRSDLRKCEDLITRVEHEAIKRGLLDGTHVISDNTNIEVKYMKPIAHIGYSLGHAVQVRIFDVPLHTALNRNKQRAILGGRNVPEDVIRKQHDRFSNTKNVTLEPEPRPVPYEGTPGKPKAFLFDLDGTTFHMGDKRSPYAHNVDVDDPDEVVLDIVRRLAGSGLQAIAMSGREEVTRELTETALHDNGVFPVALFMRENKDMRKDSIIKAELFDRHVRDRWDVQFVLDDRNQVVDMWRAMGIKTLQVEEGDF